MAIYSPKWNMIVQSIENELKPLDKPISKLLFHWDFEEVDVSGGH